MQTSKSEEGGIPHSPESSQDAGENGKVHPNAYHSKACMSSKQDGRGTAVGSCTVIHGVGPTGTSART